MKKITGLTMVIMAIFTFCITAKAQTASPDKLTNKVISNYLLVKSALAGNDAGKAKAAAKSMNTAANELAAVHLNAADKALVTKLDYDSRHISEVNLIAHQREHFESLSKNLYILLKDLKNNDNVLYKINYGSGKAFYLSESKTGPDPYKAATTGNKVVETLQPVAN